MLSVNTETSKNSHKNLPNLKNLKIDDSNSTVGNHHITTNHHTNFGITNSSNFNCQKTPTNNTTIKHTFVENSKNPNPTAKGNLSTNNIYSSLNSAVVNNPLNSNQNHMNNNTNSNSNTNDKIPISKKATFSDKFFKK